MSADTIRILQGTDRRPLLDAKDDEASLCRRGWDAISARVPHDLLLFRRGSGLVAVHTEKDKPAVHEVGIGEFRRIAADSIAWVKYVQSREGYAPKADHARGSTIAAMLGRPPTELPELRAITDVPVFAADGRLIDQPGFDPPSGVYYEPGCTVPHVPAEPTEVEHTEALALIMNDLLGDFPFSTDHDRAHALAALLNPIVRPMVDGPTPAFVFTAPAHGTGKTLLAQVCQLIAHGTTHTMTLPEREEERQKTLAAILRCHPGRAVLLDNIDAGELSSGALAALLTSERYEARTLGVSELGGAENLSTWYLSASNTTLSRELARRCVEIRLDSGLPRPEERTDFRHPRLTSWVRSRRGDLVWALLVLVRRWAAAGAPPGASRLGSYEHWSEVVGGIVASVGLTGFLGRRDTIESEDPWTEIVAAWWEEWRDRSVAPIELLRLVTQRGLDYPRLDRASSERSQVTCVGSGLRRSVDRVVQVGAQRLRIARHQSSRGGVNSVYSLLDEGSP